LVGKKLLPFGSQLFPQKIPPRALMGYGGVHTYNRIDKDAEIRSRTKSLIFGFFAMYRDRRSKMSSSRKTQHTYPFGINAPFPGPLTNLLYPRLCIVQRNLPRFVKQFFIRQTVF